MTTTEQGAAVYDPTAKFRYRVTGLAEAHSPAAAGRHVMVTAERVSGNDDRFVRFSGPEVTSASIMSGPAVTPATIGFTVRVTDAPLIGDEYELTLERRWSGR